MHEKSKPAVLNVDDVTPCVHVEWALCTECS